MFHVKRYAQDLEHLPNGSFQIAVAQSKTVGFVIGPRIESQSANVSIARASIARANAEPNAPQPPTPDFARVSAIDTAQDVAVAGLVAGGSVGAIVAGAATLVAPWLTGWWWIAGGAAWLGAAVNQSMHSDAAVSERHSINRRVALYTQPIER